MSRIPHGSIVPVLAFVLLLALVACSSVTIQTGQTEEQEQESRERQASDIRSDWSSQFESVSDVRKVVMLQTFIDSVAAAYFRYGSDLAHQWYQGNEGRGEAVPASEMRQMVDSWLDSNQPLLQGYEDIIEYGWARLQDIRFFDETTERLLQASVDNYYDVYSVVFYPSGMLRDYEEKLERARFDTEQLSRDIQDDIARYR
jgi:hypothetical protein